MDQISAVGRRKSSVARVYLSPKGSGKITINKKDFKTYFPQEHLVVKIDNPLKVAAVEGKHDISVNVTGGGVKGQAEAVVLGISRALCKLNEEYRPALKAEGLLSRDPRVVERKKPGLVKARKRTQFSKR